MILRLVPSWLILSEHLHLVYINMNDLLEVQSGTGLRYRPEKLKAEVLIHFRQ